ncbi:MAG TPA: D-alanyl-D-alanine carboxypeptidase family protein, partial [Acidimicrobiales bacterium]|nr:D-alanyl-D-alanine carboxypeptidase family protein [Acidimicrobiales bacterium]
MQRPCVPVRVLAIALAILAATAVPASASRPDAAERRREVQRQRAKAAAQIDLLRASDREVEKALDAMDAAVRTQEAQASDARKAATQASQRLEDLRTQEGAATAALARTTGQMRALAVDAYVRGTTQEISMFLDATSAAEVATRQTLLKAAQGSTTELADSLVATREDLEDLRAEAELVQTQALRRRQVADAKLRDLEGAQAEKERASDAVEARLERALAEADGLAALDKELAAEMARRQAELARRVARPAGSARASRSVPRISGSISVTTVRGITVATSIAGNIERLLAAADGAGLSLSGNGYRSSEQQIATRRANCGSSNYDIYEKPASSCRPPTARPGQSMHEQGLAIDFTNGGRLIQSRSDAGFRWLSANAGRF